MWDQVIKWAAWDYTFKVMGFIANLVTILGISSIIIALGSLLSDRRRRAEERREQRRSLLLALQGDTIGLYNAMGLAETAYGRTWTGEYRHSHNWPFFSSPMTEAALREPYLLSLNYQEIADLVSLRNVFELINALVRSKQAVVTGLAVNPSEATAQNADLIDAEVAPFPWRVKP